MSKKKLVVPFSSRKVINDIWWVLLICFSYYSFLSLVGCAQLGSFSWSEKSRRCACRLMKLWAHHLSPVDFGRVKSKNQCWRDTRLKFVGERKKSGELVLFNNNNNNKTFAFSIIIIRSSPFWHGKNSSLHTLLPFGQSAQLKIRYLFESSLFFTSNFL